MKTLLKLEKINLVTTILEVFFWLNFQIFLSWHKSKHISKQDNKVYEKDIVIFSSNKRCFYLPFQNYIQLGTFALAFKLLSAVYYLGWLALTWSNRVKTCTLFYFLKLQDNPCSFFLLNSTLFSQRITMFLFSTLLFNFCQLNFFYLKLSVD